MRKKFYISNNSIACIRIEISKKSISLLSLSEFLGTDSDYLNLLFNRQLKKTNKDMLYQIVPYIGLDKEDFFKRDLLFEKIRNDFFHAFFYCLPERKRLYEKLLAYEKKIQSTPYTIDLLLIKFIYITSLVKNYEEIRRLKDEISEIVSSLSTYYQKLYYVYVLYYLDNSSHYENIKDVFTYTCNLQCKDIHLNGRLYYEGLSIFRSLGNLEKAKNNYFQAKQCLSEANNIAMLENLNLKYSGLLRVSGEIQAALKNDLKLLEDYTVKQYRLRNIEILFNNIGWTYSLLHNYQKAVVYYQKALETLDDNDVYFNMAYCLYKIGEDNLSRTYIQQGKEAPESNSFARPFLDWLDLMIDEKYSEKSYKTLVSILKHHDTDLEDVVKDTIQIEIVNYYYYNHMYEEAIHALQPLMGKQLISPSELIFTKKNENRHDFLFSEDEITLRSQMMESDDLFFEDDELGEDEWEELDDSFSRFTHN